MEPVVRAPIKGKVVGFFVITSADTDFQNAPSSAAIRAQPRQGYFLRVT